MFSYRFVLKQKGKEKYYVIPKDVMEMEYGLPGKNKYVFFAMGTVSDKVIYLREHHLFKKRKDSRLAI